ncbi:MAG: hypothetical protein GKR90_00515 [Pseudomonadales bacterium]|nr:hypothetical protein [Pseudomonadales bacterium]
MSWEAVGSLAELIGAVAIIISIVYLGAQVRQTRIQLQAQAEDFISTRAFEAYNPVYEGNNAHIFRVGLETPEALNEDEAFVFRLLMDRQRGAFVSVIRRTRGINAELAEGSIAGFKKLFLETAGGRFWLAGAKENLPKTELKILGLLDQDETGTG